MLTLDYGRLVTLNADLSGGIKGTIDKPGGLIKIEVYAYDHYEDNGIQKLYSTEASSHDKLVYGAYSDVTNIDNYVEKVTTVPYGFVRNLDGSYRVLGETSSNNVKLLGANSRSGWFDSECRWVATRFFRWLGWKVMSFFYDNIPAECQDVITKIQSGRQPVLVKITIKEATLYDFKVPGLINGSIVNFVEDEKVQEYKIIKNLKVTILESPKEFKKATFYKQQLENAITEVNKYYTGKTGRLKKPEIKAEIGNPRILFKDVAVILKKGSRESYNFQSDTEVEDLEEETALNDNDDKTVQLLFAHTILSTTSGNPQKNTIRGFTYSEGELIKDDHFCIFSYDEMFNLDPDLVGTSGSTMAHELGHYFGLLHPFSGGCSTGDGISDTPPTEGEHWYVVNSGTPQEQLLKNPCENAPHSCNGERRQIENIMDYGPCRWLFTKEQTEQMMRRINTKNQLFSTVMVSDASVDPDKVNIVMDDQRLHNNARRKRSITSNEFSIRMLYPNAQIEYYNVEVTSDKSEKATIRIFDIYANQVCEKYVSVEKGQNHFPIQLRFLDGNSLYLLHYNSDDGRAEKIKFLGSQ
ncbi:M43 family zinc metalloprotease [Flavobacterium sp.]|uniref:M43 family zinc metalloprotease n=1 Tax=Flavobacterium sp. TaxID=239 RepID=UPI00262199E9|nr:M43 family zinc metalloprotease [Flavobacterium sp.]